MNIHRGIQNLVNGNGGASDLQQAQPLALRIPAKERRSALLQEEQGMCKHILDAASCKDEDAGEASGQFLKRDVYRFWKSFGPLLFVLCASFVTLCSFDKADVKKINDKLSAEEKTWLDPFFRGVMLQNQGIYTLYGSKPMTMIRLEPESGSNTAASNKKQISPENYHLLENWKNWEKIKSKFPLHRFAFFIKPDADDPSLEAIYFADLTKVALVLQENYNIFRKETGLEFDALNESLALEEGSEFWNKVFDHPALLGLVLGYGMKNSFCFQWKYGSSELQEKITNALSFHFSDKPHGGKATVDKLTLPIFASFSDGEDDMIEKYRKEREAIKATCEDKDFLMLTLQKLTLVDE